MSTEIALITESSIAALNEIGGIFAKSGYFKDVKDAAQAVVKIMYGRELGFSPVISMMGIHIIEGKPALSSNLMAGMVKRSGKYNYSVRDLSDTNCTLIFTENGKDVGHSSFSMADAQKAGVVRPGGSWTKYPRNMMFARALSNGLKLYCPDLSMCPVYNPEEMGAEVNEEGDVVSHPVAAPVVTTAPKVFGKPPETTPIEHLPPLETLIETANAAPTPEPPPEKYISEGQQANFAKTFREALPENMKPHAEKLRHEWLALAKFIDADGNPSSKVIPAKGYLDTRAKAVAWASNMMPF